MALDSFALRLDPELVGSFTSYSTPTGGAFPHCIKLLDPPTGRITQVAIEATCVPS